MDISGNDHNVWLRYLFFLFAVLVKLSPFDRETSDLGLFEQRVTFQPR